MNIKFKRINNGGRKLLHFNPKVLELDYREISILYTIALKGGSYYGSLSKLYKLSKPHPPKTVGVSIVKSMRKAIDSLEREGLIEAEIVGKRNYSISLLKNDDDINVLRSHIELIKKGNIRCVAPELVFKLYIYIIYVQSISKKFKDYIFKMEDIANEFEVSVQTITKAKKVLDENKIIASEIVTEIVEGFIQDKNGNITPSNFYVPIGQTFSTNAF